MKQSILVLALSLASSLASSLEIPATAYAQSGDSTSAAKVPVARRLYEEGVDAVNKGRWSVAHDRFKASYEMAPRVLTLFNLAGAQAQIGRLVEASESYRRFLRETTDGRYQELRTDATTQLETIEKQIGQLTLDVTNIDPGDQIVIDDIEFPHSALREPMPMNPGSHVITIKRDGTGIATKNLELTTGAAEKIALEVPKRVDLQLRRDPNGNVVSGGFGPNGGPGPEKEGRSVFKSPWFWTIAAVVVVGGATGAYLLTRPGDDTLVVH